MFKNITASFLVSFSLFCITFLGSASPVYAGGGDLFGGMAMIFTFLIALPSLLYFTIKFSLKTGGKIKKILWVMISVVASFLASCGVARVAYHTVESFLDMLIEGRR